VQKSLLEEQAFEPSVISTESLKSKIFQKGEYNIKVSYLGYKTFETQVTIEAQTETVLNVILEENITEVESVQVVATRKTNTETAIVLEIKEAKAVVSGISREQISRSTDRTAAEAMQRIPGITIIENRFALIRGVNSRYNSVIINNVVAPSTEIDRRTFSFDMISSGALDRMMIYKTASPEYPGDFAGGVIKLYTLNTIDKDFLTVKIETGYRAGTTFSPYMQSKGSYTDFLGFDRSYRTLPPIFPNRNLLVQEGPTSDVRQSAARMLPNNYAPIESMAIPNIGLSINYGKTYRLKGNKKLTAVNSLNYTQSYQNFERKFHRYQIWSDFSTPIDEWFEYTDNVYQKDNKVNLMSNWTYTFGGKTKIKFSNLFNQIGENETIIRNGENFFARPGEDQQNYLLGYKSRTIYTGQLEGEHKLGKEDKNKLNWVVGGSYLGELEPDLRRFRRFKMKEDENFTAMFSPSSNLFDNSRYYGELSEYTVSHGLTYVHDVSKDEKNKRTINAGYYGDYRSRNFSSRYFSTTYPGFFSPTVFDELAALPLDEIFAPENYLTQDGLILQEGTRPIDAYSASNLLTAAFISADLSFGKVTTSGGIRTEYNIQNMESQDDFGPILVNNPVLSILPSVNIGYIFNEKNLIRGGYGRTVNRPEFRELAPFLFYDYKLESSRVGNPDLKTATIDNIDLRYENYPRQGETFSVGGFYKRFINPIEDRLILTTEQSSLTFVNANFAYVYGAEVEFKKSLKDLTSSSFINKLSVNFNASYIFSRVDLGPTATAQDRVRPLQGQAPYIVNAALYYNNNAKKINASLIYNIYGRNIFAVGDVSFPTMYELERHSLDITFSKTFENGLNVKASIQNVLDAPFRYYQDSNRNGIIDDADHPIIEFRRGSLFTVSVTYDLFHKNNK
jgi:outer membrane cobalamin receptor